MRTLFSVSAHLGSRQNLLDMVRGWRGVCPHRNTHTPQAQLQGPERPLSLVLSLVLAPTATHSGVPGLRGSGLAASHPPLLPLCPAPVEEGFTVLRWCPSFSLQMSSSTSANPTPSAISMRTEIEAKARPGLSSPQARQAERPTDVPHPERQRETRPFGQAPSAGRPPADGRGCSPGGSWLAVTLTGTAGYIHRCPLLLPVTLPVHSFQIRIAPLRPGR